MPWIIYHYCYLFHASLVTSLGTEISLVQVIAFYFTSIHWILFFIEGTSNNSFHTRMAPRNSGWGSHSTALLDPSYTCQFFTCKLYKQGFHTAHTDLIGHFIQLTRKTQSWHKTMFFMWSIKYLYIKVKYIHICIEYVYVKYMSLCSCRHIKHDKLVRFLLNIL